MTSILTLLIAVAICLIIFMPLVVWMKSNYRTRKNIRDNELYINYKQILHDTLHSEDDLKNTGSRFEIKPKQRRLLTSLMMEFASRLNENEYKKLLLIFRTHGLDRRNMQHIHLLNHKRQIRRLLVYYNLPPSARSMKQIESLADSRDPLVRLLALIAILNRNPDRFMEIMLTYPHPLYLYEHLHFCSATQHRIGMPDSFRNLFQAINPSVQILALRLTQHLRHTLFEAEVLTLTASENRRVRHTAIETALCMRLNNAASILQSDLHALHPFHRKRLYRTIVTQDLLNPKEIKIIHTNEPEVALKHYLKTIYENHSTESHDTLTPQTAP